MHQEPRQECLDEEDGENDEDRRKVDPAGPPGGQQPPEGAQDRLGRAVEKLDDRVARVRVHPRDHRRDDDEPLDHGEDREEHVEDGGQEGTAEVHAPPLGPKRAVPIRTSVEPSSTATSKSWLIPIESSAKGLPKRPASRSRISRSWRNQGRAADGSSANGGTVMRPRTSRCWQSSALAASA